MPNYGNKYIEGGKEEEIKLTTVGKKQKIATEGNGEEDGGGNGVAVGEEGSVGGGDTGNEFGSKGERKGVHESCNASEAEDEFNGEDDFNDFNDFNQKY